MNSRLIGISCVLLVSTNAFFESYSPFDQIGLSAFRSLYIPSNQVEDVAKEDCICNSNTGPDCLHLPNIQRDGSTKKRLSVTYSKLLLDNFQLFAIPHSRAAATSQRLIQYHPFFRSLFPPKNLTRKPFSPRYTNSCSLLDFNALSLSSHTLSHTYSKGLSQGLLATFLQDWEIHHYIPTFSQEHGNSISLSSSAPIRLHKAIRPMQNHSSIKFSSSVVLSHLWIKPLQTSLPSQVETIQDLMFHSSPESLFTRPSMRFGAQNPNTTIVITGKLQNKKVFTRYLNFASIMSLSPHSDSSSSYLREWLDIIDDSRDIDLSRLGRIDEIHISTTSCSFDDSLFSIFPKLKDWDENRTKIPSFIRNILCAPAILIGGFQVNSLMFQDETTNTIRAVHNETTSGGYLNNFSSYESVSIDFSKESSALDLLKDRLVTVGLMEKEMEKVESEYIETKLNHHKQNSQLVRYAPTPSLSLLEHTTKESALLTEEDITNKQNTASQDYQEIVDASKNLVNDGTGTLRNDEGASIAVTTNGDMNLEFQINEETLLLNDITSQFESNTNEAFDGKVTESPSIIHHGYKFKSSFEKLLYGKLNSHEIYLICYANMNHSVSLIQDSLLGYPKEMLLSLSSFITFVPVNDFDISTPKKTIFGNSFTISNKGKTERRRYMFDLSNIVEVSEVTSSFIGKPPGSSDYDYEDFTILLLLEDVYFLLLQKNSSPISFAPKEWFGISHSLLPQATENDYLISSLAKHVVAHITVDQIIYQLHAIAKLFEGEEETYIKLKRHSHYLYQCFFLISEVFQDFAISPAASLEYTTPSLWQEYMQRMAYFEAREGDEKKEQGKKKSIPFKKYYRYAHASFPPMVLDDSRQKQNRYVRYRPNPYALQKKKILVLQTLPSLLDSSWKELAILSTPNINRVAPMLLPTMLSPNPLRLTPTAAPGSATMLKSINSNYLVTPTENISATLAEHVSYVSIADYNSSMQNRVTGVTHVNPIDKVYRRLYPGSTLHTRERNKRKHQFAEWLLIAMADIPTESLANLVSSKELFARNDCTNTFGKRIMHPIDNATIVYYHTGATEEQEVLDQEFLSKLTDPTKKPKVMVLSLEDLISMLGDPNSDIVSAVANPQAMMDKMEGLMRNVLAGKGDDLESLQGEVAKILNSSIGGGGEATVRAIAGSQMGDLMRELGEAGGVPSSLQGLMGDMGSNLPTTFEAPVMRETSRASSSSVSPMIGASQTLSMSAGNYLWFV